MASGTMQLVYGSTSISHQCNRATRRLDYLTDGFDRVRRKLQSMPERSPSGDNLERASAFLYKKNQQYDRRKYAISVLQSRTGLFMERIKTTEKTISSSIEHSYNQFHQRTGIGKTMAALMVEKLKDFARNGLNAVLGMLRHGAQSVVGFFVGIKDAIVAWYNDGGKYLVSLALSAASIVIAALSVVSLVAEILAAPITGGASLLLAAAQCAVVAATVATAFNSLVEFERDAFAAYYHYTGNKELARELHSASAGECLFGKDSSASQVFDGSMVVANIVCLLGSIATIFKSAPAAATKAASGASSTTSAAGKTAATVSKGGKLSSLRSAASNAGGRVASNFRSSFDSIGDLGSYLKNNGGFFKGIGKMMTTPITKGCKELSAFNGIVRTLETADASRKLLSIPFSGIDLGNTLDLLNFLVPAAI